MEEKVRVFTRLIRYRDLDKEDMDGRRNLERGRIWMILLDDNFILSIQQSRLDKKIKRRYTVINAETKTGISNAHVRTA